MKILMELQVRHPLLIFSSPVDRIQVFGVDHILSLFQMFFHAGAPHNHSPLAIHLFRSAEDISEDASAFSHSFKLFRDCYLIQAI